MDGERGRGYDYLPSCEAIDCVAQIFSAVGSPSRKESYSNPPCSPPLDPLFQVASGASISSTSMYVDECDLMILKMATHKKKKAHCFFDARFLGAWCQIAAFATRLAWNWVRIVRSHAIRVWFSVAAHLDLFQTIWTETLVSITHHHVLNSEMTPMLSLVMCRPYLCFTFVSSEAAL